MVDHTNKSKQTIIIKNSAEESNGFGIAGFAMALMALMAFILLICTPISALTANNSAWLTRLTVGIILWILGLIFSIIGLKKTPKGLAKAGLSISLLPLTLIAVSLFFIFSQVSTPVRFDTEVKQRKTEVIDRIKDIRTAQRAFKSKYNRFTASFDTLEAFVLTDSLELERRIVSEDDIKALDRHKKSGRKNVERFKVAVMDTIFSPKKISIDQVRHLRYIPHTNNKTQFIMETGFIKTQTNRLIPVVEVRAPYKMFLDTIKYRQEIINLIDDEENNYRYAGIKFGSLKSSDNEAGNWE